MGFIRDLISHGIDNRYYQKGCRDGHEGRPRDSCAHMENIGEAYNKGYEDGLKQQMIDKNVPQRF